MKPYVSQTGDFKLNPISILDDIVENKIDAAVLWGPIAGYYAKTNKKANLAMISIDSSRDNPEMKFDYNISMAVRYGENEWKSKINKLIENNQGKILRILEDYGVPLVPVVPAQSNNER